jgi:hypothetical protein
MKKPKLDESSIEKLKISSKMWMNVEAFSFIVIFYVVSLATIQKCEKTKKESKKLDPTWARINDVVSTIEKSLLASL